MIRHYEEVGSTLDVAHELAANGAEAGTVVYADAQTDGRGRMGRTWTSEPGAGLWMTSIERPADASGLDVLSLRVGLQLAPALSKLAGRAVHIKWPNDLYLDGKKLAGILIEARWRGAERPDWVAIGVGINLRPPASEPRAIGLGLAMTNRELVPQVSGLISHAAELRGPLTQDELDAFAARDFARGKACVEPAKGTVQGINARGELLIELPSLEPGFVAFRSGSLVLEDDS